MKPVIIRHSCSNSLRSSSRTCGEMSFRLAKTMDIFAFSKVDRRAMFRKWANSFFERLPDPSAILLDIDSPAPRTCSAKRYSFLFSRSSAMSRSLSPISMAFFHIWKSWNLNIRVFSMFLFDFMLSFLLMSIVVAVFAPCFLPSDSVRWCLQTHPPFSWSRIGRQEERRRRKGQWSGFFASNGGRRCFCCFSWQYLSSLHICEALLYLALYNDLHFPDW